MVFDTPRTQLIVEARLAHLDSLELPIAGLKVLEVGAGVGNLTGWFEDRGCQVLSTDGRPENVAEHRRRHPACEAYAVDLDTIGSHDIFGLFDLVVCYGVLYHVREPGLVLEDMARVCSGILLLETAVYSSNDWGKYESPEGNNVDQSLCGASLRLGRGLIMSALRWFFDFVYLTRTQPNHPSFPLKWPADNGRAVFVASHTQLPDQYLSETLLVEQGHES